MNSFCSQRTDGYLNFANEHERVFWPLSKKDFYQREKQTIVSAEEKLLLIWIVSVVFFFNSNVSYLNSSCKWDTDAHLNFSDWCSMIKMWFPELYYYILTNPSVYMQEIWNKQICIQCYNHLCTIAHGVIVAKVCQNVTFIICNFTLYYDCCQGPWIEGFEFFWLLGFL